MLNFDGWVLIDSSSFRSLHLNTTSRQALLFKTREEARKWKQQTDKTRRMMIKKRPNLKDFYPLFVGPFKFNTHKPNSNQDQEDNTPWLNAWSH